MPTSSEAADLTVDDAETILARAQRLMAQATSPR